MASVLAALILAAGFSSRMGTLKPLLAVSGRKTALERSIGLFRSCGVGPVLVVTGHEAEAIGRVATRAGAQPIFNPDYATGMYSSILAGMRALPTDCAAFFLLPADIALIRAGTIRLLAESFTRQPAQILYPVFAGRRGHPPLLAAALARQVLGRTDPPPEGLRSILADIEITQPEQVREVVVADTHIHLDMDTPDDYALCRKRAAHLDYPDDEETAVILSQLYPMPERGLAHGLQVSRVAEALCQSINTAGGRQLNTELCRVCGLLHDLAKGHPHHEAEGARRLEMLGFDRAAAIVGAHRDMDWQPGQVLGERELVHLADKLVRGRWLVGIEQRFQEKLELFRDDPDAVRSVRARLNLAQELARAFTAATGEDPLRVAEGCTGWQRWQS
ncbi:MAG: DVU_1551 family NTP transferase [Desulfobulbus sp.]|jgi:molybdenum cofactor cytidylyltransferase